METKFYTRPAKAGSDESPAGHYIYVDCRWQGGRVRKSTNIHVADENPFDENGNLVGTSPEMLRGNATVSAIKSKAANLDWLETQKGKCLTEEELEKEIYKIVNPAKAEKRNTRTALSEKTDNFLVYLKAFCESKPVHLKPSSLKSYNAFVTVCEGFAKKYGKTIFQFDVINREWRDKFSNFVFNELKHSFGTEDKWIKHLKTLMGRSLEEKYHTNTQYLLIKRASRKKLKNNNDIALTDPELNAMYALQLLPNLEKIRDLFVFNARTGGIRISQSLALRRAHWKGDYIEIKSTKKTGTYVFIPLHKQAKAILIKYNGNLPKVSESKMNKGLKEIGQEIESLHQEEVIYISKGGTVREMVVARYELLCTHTARRTFCTLCMERGFNKQWIMDISGHETEEAFDLYVKLKDMSKRTVAEMVMADMEKIGWA